MGADVQSISSTRSDTDQDGEVADSALTVTLVIPVWGPSELTHRCLESLVWSASNFDLVLIDNTGTYVPSVTPGNHFTIVHNAENVGFSRAINQGVALATTDIVCMFNCDATGTLDWLDNLMESFENPSVSIAGPRIVHPDGVLQTAGVRVWHGNGSAGGEEIKQELPTRDVECVTGACMAVRRDVFNALGGLDEALILGYEDVDFCLTAREAGYKVRYVQESTVQHIESGTGPERWAHTHTNIDYLNRTWGNR